MVAGVIHDVLEHLPHWRRAGVTAEQFVVDDAARVVLAEARDEVAHLDFVLRPGMAERREIRKLIRRQQHRRRSSSPALVPRPLRRVDVRDGFADRLEAAAQITGVLLLRQRGDRVEEAIARPVVIVEHRLEILARHLFLLSRGAPPPLADASPLLAARLRAGMAAGAPILAWRMRSS